MEVVIHDTRHDEWVVIAAWRPRPDWLANIEATPAAAVTVGGRRYPAPGQRFLDPGERLDALGAYAASHPLALRGLCRAMGWDDPRRPGALRRLADEHAMVAFSPSPPPAASPAADGAGS